MSEWLTWEESLPGNWKVAPIRGIADLTVSSVDKIPADDELPVRLCNYTDVYNNEFITPDMQFMRSTATPCEIKKFRLQAGDVAITKDSEEWDDIGIPALIAETAEDLVCGYHLAVLRPNPNKLEGRFLLRCMQSKIIRIHLELAANGVTRFGVPKAEIAKLPLPLPPLIEQRAIAAFLDQETERLDALIEQKEHWLALLAEKRRALLTHTITHGLDPAVRTRDPGIAWLDCIPAHWTVARVRFLAEVRGGLTLGKNYRNAQVSEYPYLRVANVQDGRLDLSNIATVFVPQNEADSCLLQPGDVLMNEGGDADKLGRGCVWRGEISPCLHQNHVFAVRPTKVSPEWLAAWTSAEPAKSYFESRAKQSTNLASISGTNVKELPVPLPPQPEQHAILAHLSAEIAKLDGLRAAVERTVTLLRERRAALISAAVTGEIRVPLSK